MRPRGFLNCNMAALRSPSQLMQSCKAHKTLLRNFSRFRGKRSTPLSFVATGFTTAAFVSFYQWHKKYKTRGVIPILLAKEDEEAGQKPTPRSLTYREMRFLQFASVQYNGQIYMTPQDFLESVTEEVPRPRIGTTNLNERDMEQWLKHTPSRRKGDNKLFRKLHDKGIISYTEYLFLLCVLTKPKSGFRIAFNMFDTDGNQIVDKKEFLVILKIDIENRRVHATDSIKLEGVFSNQQQDTAQAITRKDIPTKGTMGHVLVEAFLRNLEPIPDTTLLIHFFGPKGNDTMQYDDFSRFMENLQAEVIELEFMEFSKGFRTISEEDFARILLRYTMLDKSDVEAAVVRVRTRIPTEKGITFEDFQQFCHFLNNLDDFTIAMKMYTYADKSVSEEDFQRAVMVCTGQTLSTHLVKTVFQIFDSDGDGHLSHKEFISIMKDRLHRGSRSHLMHTQDKWSTYKTCIKNEMKSY
ncbi:calcium uptake protein 3, mitochondrial-like isoform X2 [Mytilus californianus]|uniref:calcium uptake protein 3, mitochondrial-like isoform X2 n=1 Tax=Mytilus californianus TaxID=6549 RepID=UPI002247B350|nr:calcium uptake protein 3, mitochondrial-like isoform X2 [Mytilus californianus]